MSILNKMKILIYYPSNNPTIQFNSLLPELNKKGNEIIVLTLSPRGKLHDDLEQFGIKTHHITINKTNRALFFIYHIFFLIKFCRNHKIEMVFSHLKPTNIIALAAQYFIKGKVIIFRHHFNYIIDSKNESNYTNEKFGDKLINLLAKKIVVPCSTVYNGMVKFESVPPSKLTIIPYYYNFDLYPSPQLERVKSIREQFPCKLLLLFSSRLVPLKRHIVGLEILLSLTSKHYDIKMLILDDGPEKNNLLNFVNENKLEEKAIFIGYTNEIINYIKACDILIHPSLTDASNSTIKEAGLQEKTVLVCKEVGDFDDYIINGLNGYSVAPKSTKEEMEKIIIDLYTNPEKIISTGIELKKTILDKFSISETGIKQYDQLINN